VFALRMSNQVDQDFVRGAMWEWAAGLIEALPSLRNAEAIVVGEGVPVPMRLCFDVLPEARRPRCVTHSFAAAWTDDREDDAMLKRVVEAWRRQRRGGEPPVLRVVPGGA
jgi:hypothetical protein